MTRTWRSRRALAALAAAAWLLGSTSACGQSRPSPATLDTANEDCARCRMRVSDQHFAAQIVSPGERPRFFDDLGCFVSAITSTSVPPGAMAYVADHRTAEWIPAATAVYTRLPQLDTPMNSHLIAHASADSRAADRLAAGGEALTIVQVFGNARVPDGTPK